MKTSILIVISLIISTFFISSCQGDDPVPAPSIEILELGSENSKMASPGSDLHLDVEVIAEGKIHSIQVEIHPQVSYPTKNREEWFYDSLFTEFEGLKNVDFHKHIEVPADAAVGLYHFHFIVIDQEGQQTTAEDSLRIQSPAKSLNIN